MLKRLIRSVCAVALLALTPGCMELDESAVKDVIVEVINEQLLVNSNAHAEYVEVLDLEQDGNEWEGHAMVRCRSANGNKVTVPVDVHVKQMNKKSEDVWVEVQFSNVFSAISQLGIGDD